MRPWDPNRHERCGRRVAFGHRAPLACARARAHMEGFGHQFWMIIGVCIGSKASQRRMSRKLAPGDPIERRSCQAVADILSNSCSKVVSGESQARICRLWPMCCAKLCRNSGQAWPTSGQLRPKLTDFGPTSARHRLNSRNIWPRFGQNLAKSSQTWPMLADICQIAAQNGQCGYMWLDVGQIWPTSISIGRI